MKRMKKIVWIFSIAFLINGCNSKNNVVPKNTELSIEQSEDDEEGLGEKTAVSIDGSLKMAIPEDWEVYEDPSPYDLRAASSQSYMGVFVYHYFDLAEGVKPIQMLDYHITDLMSRRNYTSIYQEEETKTLEDKTIYHIAYIGEKDLTKNIYYFSMVDFKEEESFAIVIHTSLPSTFEENLKEFNSIVESAEVVK